MAVECERIMDTTGVTYARASNPDTLKERKTNDFFLINKEPTAPKNNTDDRETKE